MDTFPILKNARVIRETMKAVQICVYVEGLHENGDTYVGVQNIWVPKDVCFQKNDGIHVLDEVLSKKEEDIASRYHLSICGISVED